MDRWVAGSVRLVVRDETGAEFRLSGGSLEIAGSTFEPIGLPTPRRRAHELAAVRGWLARNRVRLEDAHPPIAEPIDGGAELASLLRRLKAATADQLARSPDADAR
jgi:hypothetical protein